jgi:hypothetical protein
MDLALDTRRKLFSLVAPIEPSPRFLEVARPSAAKQELNELDKMIAKLGAAVVERKNAARQADVQLQELQLRPSERTVWLAPVLGGDFDAAARGAVLRQERNAAERDVKRMKAALAKAIAHRDELLGSSLGKNAAWQRVLVDLDTARCAVAALDAAEDAAFRALCKLAPAQVVAERTRNGTTFDTSGPMNLPVALFIDTTRAHAHEVESLLAAMGTPVELPRASRSSFDAAADVVALKTAIVALQARVLDEVAGLERRRRELLESAAASL